MAVRFWLAQWRVCWLVALDRNTLCYRSHRQEDSALRTWISEMAECKCCYGCPRIYVWLRWEGWPVHHKNVERLYYQEEQFALQRRCQEACGCFSSRIVPTDQTGTRVYDGFCA